MRSTLIKLRVAKQKCGSAVGSEHSLNHNRLGSTLPEYSAAYGDYVFTGHGGDYVFTGHGGFNRMPHWLLA